MYAERKAAGYSMDVPALDADSVLRYVEIDAMLRDVQPYRLLTWDTGSRYDNGRTRIGVAFYRHSDPVDAPTLTTYIGLGVGSHADDSDEALAFALSAVCMKPGDTDADYFADYTPKALEWAESTECEALSLVPCDADEARSDNPENCHCAWIDYTDEHGDETERLCVLSVLGDIECDDGKTYALVFRDLLDW